MKSRNEFSTSLLITVFCFLKTDTKFRIINPLHHSQSKTETATISRIRLMLGEHTALALGVLVAADVLDTVLKPAHAYQLGRNVIDYFNYFLFSII